MAPPQHPNTSQTGALTWAPAVLGANSAGFRFTGLTKATPALATWAHFEVAVSSGSLGGGLGR